MTSHGQNAIYSYYDLDLTPNEKELSIVNCGYFTAINSPYKINVDSTTHMLLYQHKGYSTVDINKSKVKIAPGTTVLLTNTHANTISYHNDPINERYYIYFGGYRLKELFPSIYLDDHVFATGLRFDFIEGIKTMIEDYSKNSKFTLLSLSSLLNILTKTIHLTDENTKNGSLTRILPAINYMKENFTEPPMKISEYAKMCFISPITLMKYFKKHTKMSPLEYLTSLKMTNAQSQLTNTSNSVSEIAESLSYIDPLYFSRVFKKFTGVSPSKYRTLGNGSTSV